MKIAIVDAAAFSLPYDLALCEGLATRGMDVQLFTTKFAHGDMPETTFPAVHHWFYQRRIVPFSRKLNRAVQHLFDVRRLCRRLVEEKFDVVHLQWLVAPLWEMPIWRGSKLPLVYTAHNSRLRSGSTPREKHLAEFDAVVVHSDAGRCSLADAGIRRLWTIPHGVLDHYSRLPMPARAPIELPAGPLVAFLGALRPYKGIEVLLEAWPGVRRSHPEAQLLIAGKPIEIKLPESLPAGVHALSRFLEDREFAWVLRTADVFCLPYTAIDMSGAAFSIIGAGKPLVISRVGGFGELEGCGATLVPPHDSVALTSSLVELLADEGRQRQLADEATKAGETLFRWSRIAEEYEAHYAELMRDVRRPDDGRLGSG